MKLKSFGCSFIFGTDLRDEIQHEYWRIPSEFSWPALVAKQLGYEYECFARPGSGNLQIWDNLSIQMALDEPCLYVIGWTWIDRFDYISEDAARWWWGGPTLWKTIVPVDQDPVAKMYYRNLHNEHLDKMRSLIYIQSAIDLLESNNQPFIMTMIDDLLLDRRWNTNPGMIRIQDKIQSYLTSFDGQNFLDYSRARGHAISGTMHPLESAHQDAADCIMNNLSTTIKGNITCLQNVY